MDQGKTSWDYSWWIVNCKTVHDSYATSAQDDMDFVLEDIDVYASISTLCFHYFA